MGRPSCIPKTTASRDAECLLSGKAGLRQTAEPQHRRKSPDGESRPHKALNHRTPREYAAEVANEGQKFSGRMARHWSYLQYKEIPHCAWLELRGYGQQVVWIAARYLSIASVEWSSTSASSRRGGRPEGLDGASGASASLRAAACRPPAAASVRTERFSSGVQVLREISGSPESKQCQR